MTQDMREFYAGKRVLVTGHTGFKGIWLTRMLRLLGAKVTGFALSPTGEAAKVYARAGIDGFVDSIIGDVRDLSALKRTFDRIAPEVVFHLAAQPIVRESYRDPVGTYATNVMGTVHLLECVRLCPSVRSVIIVTTDKVYDNREWCWGYRETDRLGGHDPYANSKSCAELVVESYRRSFFADNKPALSAVRAGNVIGGGDFAVDRIIPDCIRAACAGSKIALRNPHSVRPYQHVLEPLYAYLRICAAQDEDESVSGCYNVGPDAADCVETGILADIFCAAWGEGASWEERSERTTAVEANFLRLDCSKLKAKLGIMPRWNIRQAVSKTVEWAKAYRRGEDVAALMDRQIGEYNEEVKGK